MRKKKKNDCVICGDKGVYSARYTDESLCRQHAIIDEEINYDRGKIDRHGNEIKKLKTKNGKNN